MSNESAPTSATATSAATVSGHYQGERGSDYVAQRQSNPTWMGYALNFAYFKPYLKPADHVLDFGCGNGGMLPHLKAHVAMVEAVEVNPAAAKVARDLGFTVHPSIAAVGNTPRFDAIVSNHVLEHVRDVSATITELRRHLKPDGKLIVKLPIDDVRSRHQRGWSKSDVDYHLQTWTPRNFANVLFEAGYDVEESRVITSAWNPKLFPFQKIGLGPLVFWAFSILKNRRQLFAVGRNP